MTISLERVVRSTSCLILVAYCQQRANHICYRLVDNISLSVMQFLTEIVCRSADCFNTAIADDITTVKVISVVGDSLDGDIENRNFIVLQGHCFVLVSGYVC